jgi:hypothetical protein
MVMRCEDAALRCAQARSRQETHTAAATFGRTATWGAPQAENGAQFVQRECVGRNKRSALRQNEAKAQERLGLTKAGRVEYLTAS